MLITIEQGTANPSIATLLRISDGLGVGLPALVSPEEGSRIRVSRKRERTPLWVSPAGGEAFLTVGSEPPDVLELWDWTLGPGDDYRSEPHTRGTRELITVLKGQMQLSVAGSPDVELCKGDSVSFPGDLAHAYRNPGTSSAWFALTVFQPDVGRGVPT